MSADPAVVPADSAARAPGVPVRVVLVDDHDIVRRSVRDLLEISGGFEVVGEAGSALDAAAAVLRVAPDVALVDLHLGDGSGIEVCRAVRDQDAGVATLVLTAEDADRALLAAVLAGASGYVLKLVRGVRLIETLRSAAMGDLIEDQHRADALRHVETRHPAELDRMTGIERAALMLMVDGRTDREIASELGLDRDQERHLVATVLDRLGLPSSATTAGDVGLAGNLGL